MKIILLTLVIALPPVCWAQGQNKHPIPRTSQQCRTTTADWNNAKDKDEYEKAESASDTAYVLDPNSNAVPHPAPTKIGLIPARELVWRRGVLYACMRIDTARHDIYSEVDTFYLQVLFNRDTNYLARHQLYEQLLDEDDQGIR